jgi:hypothetical protein
MKRMQVLKGCILFQEDRKLLLKYASPVMRRKMRYIVSFNNKYWIFSQLFNNLDIKNLGLAPDSWTRTTETLSRVTCL